MQCVFSYHYLYACAWSGVDEDRGRAFYIQDSYWWLLLPLSSPRRPGVHPLFLSPPPSWVTSIFHVAFRSTIWKGWVSGSGAGVPGPRRGHRARRWSGSNAATTLPFPICCSSCEISRSPWLPFEQPKFKGVVNGWISQLVVK